jgi:hypothetical protein
MDVVNQVLLLLFAKTFTGEGIAAAEKEHRSGRRSMWHAKRFEAGCKTTPSVAV